MRQRWIALLTVVLVAGGLAALALTRSDRSATASEELTEPTEPSPVAPTGPYRFVVVGDFGEGGSSEASIASAIDDWTDGHPINGFVSTGDNVYQSGAPAEFAAAWTAPYGWVDSEGIPVIATLGNHDVETNDGTPVMRLLGMPARWYTKRIGPVEFFVLDANEPTNPDQLRFLEQAIAESTARWKVAVFHQPAYSCSRHGSSPEVDAVWLPILARDGVDLVLNGHDHTYQRFGPIHGTTYVVTGGGGAGLYYETDCPAGTPQPDVHETVHNFVTLTTDESTLRLQALNADGRVIDRVTLNEPRPV
jgi:3',5'-cyclic AMP phosphodiesterase CpdA